jgi:mRNA deadenylase 3'-5' endonuclease subunit Ccr4
MESKKEETLKIMSYNILAQSLISDSLHITEEQLQNISYLNIDYRTEKIFQKINELHPDIFLFQEYEHKGKLSEKLKANNCSYEILYKKRPGDHQEGCAIGFDKKKFKLEYYGSLELRTENQKNNFNKYNNFKKSQNSNIYNKENVAIFLLLQSYKTSFYYLVICSHLLFNCSRGDIKMGQIYQIIQSALLIKSYYSSYNITTIFGADLNSTPNSAIYEYITSKSIDIEYLNKANLSGQTNKNYKSQSSLADVNYQWYEEIINTYPKFSDYNIVLITKKKKNIKIVIMDMMMKIMTKN